MSSPATMSQLSFKSMPPVFVPLRFFLTAPWFGVLAAVLFLLFNETILVSRWTGETLAITHSLTLGFMLMVMIGALFQFLPIICGFAIPRSNKVSPFTHLFLSLGSLFLVSAFLLAQVLFFQLALVTLFFAFILFITPLSYLLITLKSNLILFILKFANLALIITMVLGILMTLLYAFPMFDNHLINNNPRSYTNIHMLWGLVIWTVLLIMSVSSQIIPMFYVTPVFKTNYLKVITIGLISFMLIMTAIDLLAIPTTINFRQLLEFCLSLLVLFFSVYTLIIINQRKRKITDLTINFWRLSLIMLVVSISIYWLNMVVPMIKPGKLELLLGVLFIFGFVCSAIMGMLQKIVPFILFMHIQQKIMSFPEKMHLLPNMQSLLSVKNQKIQFYLHAFSLLFLIMSLFIGEWALFAGLLMLADFLWLSYQLHKSVWLYLQINRAVLDQS